MHCAKSQTVGSETDLCATVSPSARNGHVLLCSESNPTGLLHVQPGIGLLMTCRKSPRLTAVLVLFKVGFFKDGFVRFFGLSACSAKGASTESDPIHSAPERCDWLSFRTRSQFILVTCHPSDLAYFVCPADITSAH